jgi:hypothetical protein
MKRLQYIVFSIAVLPLFQLAAQSLAQGPAQSVAQQTGVPTGHLVYSKEYTPEQILNGVFPGRPPAPPPLPVSFDADGFAKDRIFHVPAPGQHPRILFSAEDLPGIRARLQSTRSGRQMLAFVRLQLAKGIDKPGTWENRLYTDLLRGDLDDFGRLYKPGNSGMPGKNLTDADAVLKPATKWHHRDPFGVAMEMKAFVCLIDQDQREGARLGQAIAAWAAYYKPRVEAAAAGRYRNNWWRSMRAAVEQWPFLPFAYDWDYNYMTDQQRSATREVLARLTGGRYSLGMDLPAHWRNWNFLGMSMYEVLYALAIEGEPGYDPRVYRRGVDVVRDFLAYAINPSGMAHESIGYHGAAMGHFSELMIAMANRGDNFFTQSHYRANLDQWYVQALQPYGREWTSDGDLGNFPPSDESLMVAKYFYPNDARLDYVFQNLPVVQKDNFSTDFFMEPMLITAQDAARDRGGKLMDYHAGADFHLPLSFADEHRGVMIARSAWNPDALYMNFTCHPDTTFASHDHADRGRFALSAGGRNWALQDSRPHESAQTSLVLIDGEGEGFFAPPAQWLGMSDTADASLAGCDMKYPYSWQWRKEAATWSRTDSRLEFPHYAPLKEKVDELVGQSWEYDPTPGVVAYYANYLKGNPLMWDEDSWVVRQPHNPVLYAFRTAGVVRGAHPYALVIDDLKKDGQAHVYDWIMQLPEDVYLKQQSRHDGMLDITLAEQKGPRRLLLRFFEAGSEQTPQDATAEHFRTEYKLMGLQAQGGAMYRLNVPARAVAYRGKALLYAYREGEELPRSQWDAKAGRATAEWNGQSDELAFDQESSGRSAVSVRRGGKVIASER